MTTCRRAAQKIRAGPAEPAFGRRFRTSPRCFGRKVAVVNVGSKVQVRREAGGCPSAAISGPVVVSVRFVNGRSTKPSGARVVDYVIAALREDEPALRPASISRSL